MLQNSPTLAGNWDKKDSCSNLLQALRMWDRETTKNQRANERVKQGETGEREFLSRLFPSVSTRSIYPSRAAYLSNPTI